jgi:hypothetical protein
MCAWARALQLPKQRPSISPKEKAVRLNERLPGGTINPSCRSSPPVVLIFGDTLNDKGSWDLVFNGQASFHYRRLLRLAEGSLG